MTAPTKTRSAYPRTVDELIPHARELAADLGEVPSHNKLMKTFKVGHDKAKLLIAALDTTAAESPLTAQVEPSEPAPVEPDTAKPSEPAAPPELDAGELDAGELDAGELDAGKPASDPFAGWIPKPLTQYGKPLPPLPPFLNPDEIALGPWPSSTAPPENLPLAPVVSDSDSPAEAEIPHSSPRPGAVIALVASVAATLTGVVVAAHTPPSVLLGQPWPVQAGAGALVVVVLLVLAWSTASVLGRLFTGRTARDVALDLASWTVAGVAGYLAAYGQVKFAQWAGVTGNMRFLVPGILEPSVVVLLLLANRRVKRRRAGHPAKPVGKLLALAAVLGGFAVYTNVVHAGGKAGLVFGAATVVGLILWWVKLQDDAAPDDWDDAPHSKRLSRRTSRYRVLRWVILPAQTRRAWLISLDHSIADAETGLAMARRWRRAYDESRQAAASRRLARRYASQQIDAFLLDQH